MLGAFGISNSICAECRTNKAKDGVPVDCENPDREYLCWLTNRPANDPEAPMAVLPGVSFIINCYNEVTRISSAEKFEFVRNGKKYAARLPTISGLGVWAEYYDGWQTSPFTKSEAIRLIGLYHFHFFNTKLSAITA